MARALTAGSGTAPSNRSSDMTTLYEILSVAESATPDEIKVAYRRQAMRWHPDRNPDNRHEAEERFKEIANAYRVLSDPKLRSEYDDELVKVRARADGGKYQRESGAYSAGLSEEEAIQMFFEQMLDAAFELAAGGRFSEQNIASFLIQLGCPDPIARAAAATAIKHKSRRVSQADIEEAMTRMYSKAAGFGEAVGSATKAGVTSLTNSVVKIGKVAFAGLLIAAGALIVMALIVAMVESSNKKTNQMPTVASPSNEYSRPAQLNRNAVPAQEAGSVGKDRLDAVIADLERRYPEFSPDSAKYSQPLVDRALAGMAKYLNQGIPRPDALEFAARDVMANARAIDGWPDQKTSRPPPSSQPKTAMTKRGSEADRPVQQNPENPPEHVEPRKPENSHWQYAYGNRTDKWSCNIGYRLVGNVCEQLPSPPQNAGYTAVGKDVWACRSGYMQLIPGGPCVSDGTR